MAAAGRGPGRYRPAFRSATSIGGSDRRGQGRQGSDNWPAPSVALGTGLTLGKAIIPRSVLSRGPNPWKSRPRRAPPQALKNTSVRTRRVARTRRYLTSREVEKLMKAARDTGRYGHRDATMILIAYRHGLRACELCDLQWPQVELNTGHLHVRRSKRGTPSVSPMQGDEIGILDEAKQEGIAEKTLRRAKKDLGVKSRKERGKIDGEWLWELPKKATFHPKRESWPSSYCQGFEHVVVVEHIALNRDPCACRPPCDSCT